MKTPSTSCRPTRERRIESPPVSPAIAAAAAFVVMTAFAALGPGAASAEDAARAPGAISALVRQAPASQGAVLNLGLAKTLALALPDGAEYSLRSLSGTDLDGSKLAEKSNNDFVNLLARDGLLFIEAVTTGSALLSIEAPRLPTQTFVLRVSGDGPASIHATLPVLEAHAAAPTASIATSPAGNNPVTKSPAANASVAKTVAELVSRPHSVERPAVSLVTTVAAQTAIALPTAAKHEANEKTATRQLLSMLRGVAKPVAPRTTAVAQVAPPLPVLEVEPENETAYPLQLNSGTTLPSGISLIQPQVDPPLTGRSMGGSAVTAMPYAIVPDLENEAALAATAQVSPNVPAPANLPNIRIPYQTRAALPAEVARAVDDPSVNRPKLSVSRGMARILAFRQNILAVFFSDENVMDARAINARTLAVTGKGNGKSTLAVFLARTPDDVVGRAVIYNIDVYSASPQVVEVGFTDPVAARQAIEAAINDPRVNVSVIQRPDGALVARLTGTLRDKSEIEAVASTAGLFVPNVISSLYADASAISLPDALGGSRFSSEGMLQTKLRGILSNDSIVITALPGGTTLTATVGSPGEAEALLGILPYLDRKIQPIIVVRGAPEASKYYNSDRPVLFGEDFEMTRRLSEVTGLDTVYVVRTARNALAVYGTVRNRTEYDRLRRYSLLLPQLQDAVGVSQSVSPAGANGATATSAAVTTSVSAQAPALSAANGVAPVQSTSGLTGLRGSNMPIAGYEFPTQIQMFVRILDENAAAVRLVTVDSSVVEISREALRDLGTQFGSVAVTNETNDGGNITRTIDPTFSLGSFLAGNGFGGSGGFSNINPFRARLAALYQNGTARILSKPNLTAIEGAEAQITIGGSRPVPSIQSTAQGGGTNTSSVEFRRFGIILTMRPTVADDDTIILQIRGDVTDLDFTTAITLGGAVIPGERVRSVDTTVTMREGDTLVLGGLITNEQRKLTSKVPFLGDLPLIGKLFQSKRFENNESELAIFLTPSIRRQRGSDNLREIIQANPSFPKLPGLQDGNSAFDLSTINQ